MGKRDLPANDLKDLVTWLKANPDKATQGTSGAGSPAHIGGILLQSILGSRWVFVPYRGANPTMQALLAANSIGHSLHPIKVRPKFAPAASSLCRHGEAPHGVPARRSDRR